jgi:RNA polymerase sigma factor (sigma-70 family)
MAEVAAQEAMLEYLTADAEICNPTAWISLVAANKARDRLRADKGLRRRQRVHRFASFSDAPALARRIDAVRRAPSPSAEVAERSVLLDALAGLDELTRQVVAMSLLERHPASEVAEATGLTEAAVYQRVRRARLRLRESLDRG